MQSELRGKVGSFFKVTHINLAVSAPYYQKLGNVLDLDCTARQCWLIRPILVPCSIVTPAFISLRKHLHVVIGQLNEYQFFIAFLWSTSDTPPASQCITVQWPIWKTLCWPCIAAIAGFVSRINTEDSTKYGNNIVGSCKSVGVVNSWILLICMRQSKFTSTVFICPSFAQA